MSQIVLSVFLILAGVGFGCWVGELETRRKRGNWRHYGQSTDILKDYK